MRLLDSFCGVVPVLLIRVGWKKSFGKLAILCADELLRLGSFEEARMFDACDLTLGILDSSSCG